MYLHQGLIDVLLLQVRMDLFKLQSYYTILVSPCKDNEYKEWYNYHLRPNSITKLRYQQCYNITYNCDIYCNSDSDKSWDDYLQGSIVRDFNYLLGPILHDNSIWGAVGTHNVVLLKICLEYGAKVDIDLLNHSVYNYTSEIFRIILDYGVIPNYITIYVAAKCGNIEVMDICIKYGLHITRDILDTLVVFGRTELFKKYMHYIVSYDTTLQIAKNHGRTEIIDLIKEIKLLQGNGII